MSKPTTAAGQLRDWLEWAGGRLAGVPNPGIVDRIEREARQQALERVEPYLTHSPGSYEYPTCALLMSGKDCTCGLFAILTKESQP